MPFFDFLRRIFCCTTKEKEDSPGQIYLDKPGVNDECSLLGTLSEHQGESVTFQNKTDEYRAGFSSTQVLGEKVDNKPTLVLDLDNTLICPTTKQPTQPSHEITISHNGKSQVFWIIERPFLNEFLRDLHDKYEIIVYTAGIKEYGVSALSKIDPNKYISFLVDRRQCIPFTKNSKNQDLYIKNLNALGRNLKRVILVDDHEYSFVLHPENGQYIPPFNGDMSDTTLLTLKNYLIECSSLENLMERKPLQYA